MLVRDAVPGQVLFAPGRKAMIWSASLSDAEQAMCDQHGFKTAVLLPAWDDGSLSSRTVSLGSSGNLAEGFVDCLLYIGPLYLDTFVGGLKKHHIFLADGMKIALQGYDFTHLNAAKPL